MGLSDDELDGLTNEMMEALGNADGLMDIENSDADTDDEGKTATFPFLNRLFGGMGGQRPEASGPRRRAHARPERPRAGERPVPDRPPAAAAGGPRRSFWITTASTSPSAPGRASWTP